MKRPLSHGHWQGEVVCDWGELNKRGINGIILVIVGLRFWGLLAKGGMCQQKDLWDDVVEDVKWFYRRCLDCSMLELFDILSSH